MHFGLQCLVLGVIAHLTKGKVYSLPYASDGSCRNNKTEYFTNNRCCSRCRPGTRVTTVCTMVADTVCEQCQNGTYSDNFNYYRNCFKCTKCLESRDLIYTKQCTSVSNAECACKPDWYCSGSFGSTTCERCKRKKKCAPGQGVTSQGKAMTDNKCIPCPEGTFSNEYSIQPCQPHTRCDSKGMKVLHPGTSENDTVCDMTAVSLRVPTPTTTPGSLLSDPPITSSVLSVPISAIVSKYTTPVSEERIAAYWIAGLAAIAAAILALLTMTFIIRQRKVLTKPAVKEKVEVGQVFKGGAAIHHNHTECQCLLVDSKPEPSVSSSDSHSQTESSPGRSAGGAPDGASPDHASLPSPCVNLSITATFNCQLNPTTGTCSIPVGPPAQPTQPPSLPTDLPLSQEEELCSSCQPEENKDPLLVQESGKTVY